MRGEAAAQLSAYPDRSSRKKKKSLAALERGGRAGWRRGRGKGLSAHPPKIAFDFCDSVHVFVPKPYDWLSSKPAISIY